MEYKIITEGDSLEQSLFPLNLIQTQLQPSLDRIVMSYDDHLTSSVQSWSLYRLTVTNNFCKYLSYIDFLQDVDSCGDHLFI